MTKNASVRRKAYGVTLVIFAAHHTPYARVSFED